MGHNGGDHHKYTAANGQSRQHKPLSGFQIRGLLHEQQHHGNVESVDIDDGQFRRIKIEGTEPAFRQVSAVEIYIPGRT